MNKFTLTLFLFSAMLISSLARYDEALATELAHASQASYCKANALYAFRCGVNCDYLQGYQTIDHKEYRHLLHTTSYTTFINHSTKKLVVAFRGTNSAAQLFKEVALSIAVLCPFCKSPNSKISNYFISFYEKVFQRELLVSMKATAIKYADYDFIMTGHSLGGAFATIAALHLSHENIFPADKLSLYTFGSPRVGNIDFAQEVFENVKQSYRIVHHNDIVPHLPPMDKKCGLGRVFKGWHVSNEIFYNHDFSSYRECTGGEDMSCSNSIPFYKLRVSDHLIYMGARSPCVHPLEFLYIPSTRIGQFIQGVAVQTGKFFEEPLPIFSEKRSLPRILHTIIGF